VWDISQSRVYPHHFAYFYIKEKASVSTPALRILFLVYCISIFKSWHGKPAPPILYTKAQAASKTPAACVYLLFAPFLTVTVRAPKSAPIFSKNARMGGAAR
jgi:hypothetical protein